jgi:hypothetical protein
MRRNTVDSIARAVVRRLQGSGPPARRFAGHNAPLTASVAAPRRARKPGQRPPAGHPIDLLANALASAVTRRLAKGQAAPGIPLAASRLTRNIVRNVTRQFGTPPGVEPVPLNAIDPAAAAKAMTEAFATHGTPPDPAAIMGSAVSRRLNSVRLVGTPADARVFARRVGSIVTASLRSTRAEAMATAAAANAPAACVDAEPAAAAAPQSSSTAAPAGRKRD